MLTGPSGLRFRPTGCRTRDFWVCSEELWPLKQGLRVLSFAPEDLHCPVAKKLNNWSPMHIDVELTSNNLYRGWI
jgi:hypothetical protein